MKDLLQTFRAKPKRQRLPLYWRGWSIKILWPILSLELQRILSISKTDYFSKCKWPDHYFFNNSASQFASFFTTDQFIINGIGRSEKIIDGELQKRKMIDFIIKSTLLSVLYITFCLKEKIHQFNRFYLLFSLVSLSIPFITIEVIQESISPLIGKR
jgi:hypothetical protein